MSVIFLLGGLLLCCRLVLLERPQCRSQAQNAALNLQVPFCQERRNTYSLAEMQKLVILSIGSQFNSFVSRCEMCCSAIFPLLMGSKWTF